MVGLPEQSLIRTENVKLDLNVKKGRKLLLGFNEFRDVLRLYRLLKTGSEVHDYLATVCRSYFLPSDHV